MKSWKKRLTALLLVFLLLVGTLNVAAFAEEEASQPAATEEQAVTEDTNTVKPSKVKISGPKYVAKGKKVKLKATVSPAEASQKVKWTSETPSIAKVDSKGNVTGIRAGTAKITAKAGSKKATFTIQVMPQPVQKVTIKGASSKMVQIGGTLTLKASRTPDSAGKGFEWTSSDPGIATVSAKGVVTGVSLGTVTITAKATDGSKKKANVTVEVTDQQIGPRTYRALLIGEETHLTTDAYGYVYYDICKRNTGDMNMMASLLKKVKGPDGSKYKVTTKKDATYDNIRSLIQSTFAETTANDVSLFFIATHGDTSSTGTYAGALLMPFTGKTTYDVYRYYSDSKRFLTFSTLAYWLESNIKGEVIVIIESCGAGSAIYIGPSEENGERKYELIGNGTGEFTEDPSFNPSTLVSEAVNAFKSKDHPFEVPNTGELRKNKFYVLAAARHHESSWGSEYYKYNYFTKWLVDGAKGPADTNGDKMVDLNEMFKYIKKVGDHHPFNGSNYQHVQRYPVGSKYQLFALK